VYTLFPRRFSSYANRFLFTGTSLSRHFRRAVLITHYFWIFVPDEKKNEITAKPAEVKENLI